MNTATIAPALDRPLAQEHRHALMLANERAKKIRKAAGVAAFNGWVTGIFAACSAPFVFLDITTVFITVGLSVIAYNEFRGRKGLLRFDPSSPTMLGWNQVGLMAMIVAYCVWMLITGLTSSGPFAAEVATNPELRDALASFRQFDHLYKDLVIAVYGTVIVLTAIFQGLNALYYFTRRELVEAYVQETPEWVLDVQHMMTAN